MGDWAGRHRWLLAVIVLVTATVAFNTWWIAVYRHGYPLTIDEAGYIAFGLEDHLGLQNGGLSGWWNSVQGHAPYAPLVPAVTSLAMIVKTGVLEAFGVLIGFLALLVFASFGIGKRLAGPRLGALAALVVATAPGSFLFTREYVFAMGVAATLSCAVYALLRSNGLLSGRWAVASGVTVGFMLLARTMTIAFVPAIILAAVVTAAARARGAGGEPRLGRRALNLSLLLLAGFAVAAPWYLKNIKPVYEYLTGFGYGAESTYYGTEHSWISWGKWHAVASRITLNDLLVPLAALILLGLLVVAAVAVRRVAGAHDRRAALLALAGSDAFTVALVFACCYVALSSSRNGGEGFTIPITVLLPPLAVIALNHLRRNLVVPALAALGLVTALNVASNSNLWDSLARTRYVSVPGLGSLPWINGTPQAVSAIRSQVPGPPTRFVASDRRWVQANEALAATVLRLSSEGATQPVAFASRNRALNTSTLLLGGMLDASTSIWLAQLTAEPDDSVATYERELVSPEFGTPGILVTMNRNTGDFPPLITQSYAVTAAKHLGFHKVRTMALPAGLRLYVWVKGPPPAAGGRTR